MPPPALRKHHFSSTTHAGLLTSQRGTRIRPELPDNVHFQLSGERFRADPTGRIRRTADGYVNCFRLERPTWLYEYFLQGY